MQGTSAAPQSMCGSGESHKKYAQGKISDWMSVTYFSFALVIVLEVHDYLNQL